MSTYAAPIRDMKFVINELVGLEQISGLPGCEEFTADLVDAVLEEAGKFAAGVLDPLNKSGDLTGARFDNNVVTAAPSLSAKVSRIAKFSPLPMPRPPETITRAAVSSGRADLVSS